MIPWMRSRGAEAGALALGGRFAGGGYAVGPGGGVVVTVGGGNVPTVSVDSGGNLTTSGLDTSPAATDAREKAGAAAALDLVAHGYNPDDQADNQKLVAAIAGACCLGGPLGATLGAVVEALYQVGEVMVGPMCSMGLLICKFGCTSTGNFSPSMWANLTPPAAKVQGPQAALWPMVVQLSSDWSNCKPSASFGALYQGFQALWNKCFDASSTVTFAVHTPESAPQSLGYDPAWGQTDPNSDPNSYFNSYRIAALQNGVSEPYTWLTVNAGPITAYGQQALSGGGRFGGRGVRGGGVAPRGTNVVPGVIAQQKAAATTKLVLGAGAALAAVAMMKPSLLRRFVRR